MLPANNRPAKSLTQNGGVAPEGVFDLKFNIQFTKFALTLFVALGFALVPSGVRAQETSEAQVIEEVIAQINGDVITLSQVRREMKQATEALARTQNMDEAKAREEVEKRKSEIIANIITEQLVMQQGKELGFSDKVEAEVNRRMIALAKEQNIPFAQLDDAMRGAGIDPASFRNDARRGIMTGYVFSEEVDRKVYFSFTPDELRKYYDANQAKFRKPETLTLSEIYLSKAGKSETDVRTLADRLVREARSGKDFGELATINSDRESSRAAKGKIGVVSVTDITKADVAAALKPLKAGEVTNPLSSDDGLLILRVDAREGAAAPTFNEQQVRGALTEERSTKERVAYLNKLRNDAYLKIADSYRAGVEAALNKAINASNNTAAPTATSSTASPNTVTPNAAANGTTRKP